MFTIKIFIFFKDLKLLHLSFFVLKKQILKKPLKIASYFKVKNDFFTNLFFKI